MTSQPVNRFEWCKSLMQVRGLSPTVKTVASALAVQFANDETGQLNPSQKTVADYLGVSLDTIKRAIRTLKATGWLAVFGNGGRSKVPNVQLRTPGNIVPFHARTEPKSAPKTPEKRGADTPSKPASRPAKRGADLPRKGVQNCPPQYEQSKEQKERAWKTWERHRFSGNAVDGRRFLDKRKQHHELSLWARWLSNHGFPRLYELPIAEKTRKGGVIFALPHRRPPEGDRETNEALQFFADMTDAMEVRHAAQ